MIRLLFSFAASVLLAIGATAQFAVGHTTITFNDPDRTGGFGSGGGPGRQIQTEIYYPAANAGENVDVVMGSYPVVVIGHGFLMTWDAYDNYWDLLVLMGYIVALPRTEGNFSPSHNDFGLDIALVADRLRALDENPESLFFDRVAPQAAVGGHSMGGGASVIAAANGSVTTYFGLASAETNPSAVAAASNVEVPALMFAGSSDDVTPPSEHQIPIYNAFASDCKAYVSLTGGGHCFFANPSGTCDLGEAFSSGNITLSREEQLDLTYDYLVPWLDFWLKGNASAWTSFTALLEAADGVTTQQACESPVAVQEQRLSNLSGYPNPCSQEFRITGDFNPGAVFQLFSPDGRMASAGSLTTKGGIVDVSALVPGLYLMVVEDEGERKTLRLMKQ